MDYKAIFNIEDLKNHLSGKALVAFDFKTAPDKNIEKKRALDAHKSHIVGISFSVGESSGIYLLIAHRIGRNDDLPEIWQWLKTELFENTAVTKITHNFAFESQFLYARGIVVQEPCYDTTT
jgi:DNA polymerase-1